jgi:phenylacetate-CoA ligase
MNRSGDFSDWRLKSALAGSVWPALPAPESAATLAVVHQLEHSQWLAPEGLLAGQLRQLEALLKHAYATVPWYQKQWRNLYDPSAPLTYERVAALPQITRRDVQTDVAGLRSTHVPPGHGKVHEGRTSGSTGAPLRSFGTGLTRLYWNAFTLRDHLWHRRDLSRTLAVVRRESKASRAQNWGRATAGIVETGPGVGHPIDTDASTLLDWLCAEKPGYLLTYPSLMRELARLSLARDVRPEGLLEVRTFAEALPDDLRVLCRTAWDVPVTDMYSAVETGYLALQCPEHEHYHVQSEGVLLEVLHDAGRPCGPGEVGRVVITTLHNFVMPLVRYDIGDYAEVGPPCPCGRGLPVLRRILGRVRNTLVTADGKRYWPILSSQSLLGVAPIRQHQFVQTAYDRVEVRLVMDGPLTADQTSAARRILEKNFPPGIRFDFVLVDKLTRSAGGKFEDFVSQVA